MKLVVTGGAGFIGSHIVELLEQRYPSADIVVIDKLTYAASTDYIAGGVERGRVRLVVADVADFAAIFPVIESADLVVHAAAESHVDRSFGDPLLFSRSNILGTHAVMEAARLGGVKRTLHVSTDEVYGEVHEGYADEETVFRPTTPYSASKAAAEMIVRAYHKTFRLPVVTVRGNNAYGRRQFPEKLIARAITSLLSGAHIPLHGRGLAHRHYVAVEDFASAVVTVAETGAVGEAYNIGSTTEMTNIDVVQLVCDELGHCFAEHVHFVPDRLHNDRRYAVDWSKLAALGWSPRRQLRQELPGIIAWYRENLDRLFNRQRADLEGFVPARAEPVSWAPVAALADLAFSETAHAARAS